MRRTDANLLPVTRNDQVAIRHIDHKVLHRRHKIVIAIIVRQGCRTWIINRSLAERTSIRLRRRECEGAPVRRRGGLYNTVCIAVSAPLNGACTRWWLRTLGPQVRQTGRPARSRPIDRRILSQTPIDTTIRTARVIPGVRYGDTAIQSGVRGPILSLRTRQEARNQYDQIAQGINRRCPKASRAGSQTNRRRTRCLGSLDLQRIVRHNTPSTSYSPAPPLHNTVHLGSCLP